MLLHINLRKYAVPEGVCSRQLSELVRSHSHSLLTLKLHSRGSEQNYQEWETFSVLQIHGSRGRPVRDGGVLCRTRLSLALFDLRGRGAAPKRGRLARPNSQPSMVQHLCALTFAFTRRLQYICSNR